MTFLVVFTLGNLGMDLVMYMRSRDEYRRGLLVSSVCFTVMIVGASLW